MGSEKMTINCLDDFPQLGDYSSKLLLPEKEYNAMRNSLRGSFLRERKRKRDLKWFLKRMNFTMAMIILNSYRNAIKYHSKLVKYL